MGKKIWLIVPAAVLIAALALYFVVFHKKEDTSQYPRVIVLGLDGAGWNFINPMLERGLLPHLKALMDEGSYGVLETIKPTKSPVIWTSIATGKSMLKHGIVDFTHAGTGADPKPIPFTSVDRRVKAFWNILSDHGRSVGVVNWHTGYPPEKVNGFMVSDHLHEVGRTGSLSRNLVTYPTSLQKTLEFTAQKDPAKVYRQENLPNFKKRKRLGAMDRSYPRIVLKDETAKLDALYMLKRYPVEVFAAYFSILDFVNHFIYWSINPKLRQKGRIEEQRLGHVSPETREALDATCSRLMEPFYAYADRIVGEFLDAVGHDVTLIVCSDHSFLFHNGRYAHYEALEIPHGILLIKGPNIRKGYKIPKAHIYDVLPTMLYSLGMPVARDMDGKVLTDIFDRDFLDRKPVAFIPTYEDGKKNKPAELDPATKEKLLEELRALGYIK